MRPCIRWVFNNDAEMQAKFVRGDATMRRGFRAAAMYLIGKHTNVDPAEEAAYRAKLTRGEQLRCALLTWLLT